jgi:hypothetical protein
MCVCPSSIWCRYACPLPDHPGELGGTILAGQTNGSVLSLVAPSYRYRHVNHHLRPAGNRRPLVLPAHLLDAFKPIDLRELSLPNLISERHRPSRAPCVLSRTGKLLHRPADCGFDSLGPRFGPMVRPKDLLSGAKADLNFVLIVGTA